MQKKAEGIFCLSQEEQKMNRRKQKRSIALLLCALLAAALLTGCGQQEASVPEDQD